MADRTVRDVLGDIPEMEFEWGDFESIDPKSIWANYDKETDSFILYTTGKPRGGIKVYIGDDMYAIVDRESRKAIGFYVENWEGSFVPANKELQMAWEAIKPNPQKTLIMLLRILAFWLIGQLRYNAEDNSHQLQPA